MMTPQTLVLDARWIQTGIGTYTYNLLKGLREQKNGFRVRAITHSRNSDRLRPICDEIAFLDIPIYTVREQFAIPAAARGAALLHVPHYNAPLLHPGRLLVTIHDLVHISDPTFRRSIAARLYARPMLHCVARKASRIITVSDYSRQQIIERLGVEPEKITVIHNGVSPRFRNADRGQAGRVVREAVRVRRPYLLYVGNLRPHKNVMTLLRALAILRDRRVTDYQLLIVGDESRWKQELVKECARLGIEERVTFVAKLSDDLLAHVYSAAEVLIMPSRIEGFGLPVLEAMASGTPVVCARSAALPEVAGNAAEYFDPGSAEDLASAIRRVLESPELQTCLRVAGLERARAFSWEKCVAQHYRVYQEMLDL